MEIAPMVTTTSNTNNVPVPVPDLDSPEPGTEAHTQIYAAKPISFSNGKGGHHHHAAEATVTYRECLKNHAAGIGGLALDGCGEFMQSPASVPAGPTSLKCAACGCHRNFHRRDDPTVNPAATIEFRPQNRHQPPPPLPLPPLRNQDDDSAASPPPISSSYMLLALSGSKHSPAAAAVPVSHKRFRTKFSQYQKERMQEFAERVGWRMPKADDAAVRAFCRQIGVDKVVFKVWMHNNKNSRNGRGGSRRGAALSGCGEKVEETNIGGGVATNGSSSTS